MFARPGGTIVAQPFDAASATGRGEPVPLVVQEGSDVRASLFTFSVSRNGVLAYTPAVSAREAGGTLVWVDAQGQRTAIPSLTMTNVEYPPVAEFRFAPPVLLFESGDYVLGGQPPSYDVAPDGRFLMLERSGGTEPRPASPPIVVLNWVAELERRSGR